jgi:hypothetical protein
LVSTTDLPVSEIETIYSHSSFEKSIIIERTMQYIKDRTKESFMTTFHAGLRTELNHVKNWLNLFIDYHNKALGAVKWNRTVIP